MPWPIRYHEQAPDKPQPGDIWPVPSWLEDAGLKSLLSEEYFQRWRGKRPPLVVRLPNGGEFCIDSRPTGGGSGWDVMGEPPNITVHPSIVYNKHLPGRGYHGWLQNGVLSDDLEGRTY